MSTGMASADPPRSVGRVTWGGPTVAELFADGSWRVTRLDEDRRAVADNLAGWYAEWDHHASLHYGQGILPDLARRMGGSHVFHQPPPAGPDEIN